jgi:hypothetical protein
MFRKFARMSNLNIQKNLNSEENILNAKIGKIPRAASV